MKRQKGFTMIELIVVIVILGILAAFAIPRYFSMEKEARASTVKGLAGSIKSASAMVHGLALTKLATLPADHADVTGITSSSQITAPDGTVVSIDTAGSSNRYYPVIAAGGIDNALGGNISSEWNVTYTDPVTFSPKGVTNPAQCQVSYTYAASTAPVIAYNVNDCSI